MNILGINGSPRIGGNTEILLDKVLGAAETKGARTEKVILNALRFSPCQECEEVRDDGLCLLEDDWLPLSEKIEEAEIIVLASPIFFGSVTAQTKMMIDRFHCLWRAKYILKRGSKKKKKGYFISVEASQREDFFDNAKAIIKNLFATIDTCYEGELLFSGISHKGGILEYPDALKEALRLGERIVS